jgi:hypothetical protein
MKKVILYIIGGIIAYSLLYNLPGGPAKYIMVGFVTFIGLIFGYFAFIYKS